MISANNISIEFGGFTLIKDANFLIKQKDRVALVGKNGAGKTTMLKAILGLQPLTNGSISNPKDFDIGYLPQEMACDNDTTVFEETKKAFANIHALNAELEEITQEIETRTDYESDDYHRLIDKITHISQVISICGANKIDGEIEKVLYGLGFSSADLERLTVELSGGWRMRIELAKILLQAPDLLLLDEPTNHLDIESIEWLEDFLKTYSGSIVLISHDRRFLDNATNRTLEISLNKITDYNAPYSKYLILKEERQQQQLASYENQQKQIKETEKFIERFRYKATKAVQVQSRIKQLEKIDRLEIEETDSSAINLRFEVPIKSGRQVVEIENLSKSFGFKNIIDSINLGIQKGEKVAFVGKNGEGKTTLSRIIVGELDFEGKCTLGHNVKIGYFAQKQTDTLDGEKTVLQTIDDVAVGEIRSKIRNILGSFLFSGEEVDKKVKILSGGEKTRLSLISLLLEPRNLLILDEPTNHLDIVSKEVLKNAIKNYEGTVIIVSHDRFFLEGLTDKVYEFRNHMVKEYLGDINYFLEKRKIDNMADIEKKDKSSKNFNEIIESTSKVNYQEKKEQEKEIRRARKKVEDAEAAISKTEKEIADMEKALAGSFDNNQFVKYNKLKKTIDEQMKVWEELSIRSL